MVQKSIMNLSKVDIQCTSTILEFAINAVSEVDKSRNTSSDKY